MFRVGSVGSIGRAVRRSGGGAAPGADFTLSSNAATTAWASVAIGDLVPSGAPAGAYFVLVGEPAGLAVVNG